MNKLILLSIIVKALRLYQDNQLTSESYAKVIENTPFQVLKTDKTLYEETKLLCYIFETTPYYSISYYFCTFNEHLKAISKGNKDLENISDLIESYLCDIFCNIDSRITTEINAHIYELAEIYHQSGELNYELTINRIKKQLIPPPYIVSMETAESIFYVQEKIPGFKTDEDNLREQVSKNNYRKKSNSERSLKRYIIKHFTEDSFEDFIIQLENNLKKHRDEDNKNADMLLDYYKPPLRKLFSYAIVEWEKIKQKKEEEEINQYKLTFI